MDVNSFVTTLDDLNKSGALLIYCPSNKNEMELGIALSPTVQAELNSLDPKPFSMWTHNEINAFSVVSEEISHFKYLVFHSTQQRGVSQLELEFQGEIDKFLLLYIFSKLDFNSVFSTLFEHFSISDSLTNEEKDRYQMANQLSKEFLLKNRDCFANDKSFSDFLSLLRALYRMGPQEKFSLKHRL